MIELFAGLPEADLAEIESMTKWHHLAAAEVVFDQDSHSRDVYFVVSGRVRVLTASQPDREVALADVGAGDHFGELAAIDGGERSAKVVAQEDSLIASIEGPAFKAVMLRFPEVGLRLVEGFARIIRTLDARVTDLSSLTDGQRVMVELVRLAQPDPRLAGNFHIADLPNHKEIASWAGTSREAVAQTIGELARMGVVERRSMSLLVHDWSKLKAMSRAMNIAGEA